MVFREVFVDEAEEFVSDVGVNVLAKGRVVPEYVVSLSVFAFGGRRRFVVQCISVAAFV